MNMLHQVFWLMVNLRILGHDPALPSEHESLIEYIVTLQLQYSRACSNMGSYRRSDATAIAEKVIQLLGPIHAAAPLPHRLLVLLHRSRGVKPPQRWS